MPMSIPERPVTAAEQSDSHSPTLRPPAFDPDIDLLEQLKGKTPEEFRAVIKGVTEAILKDPTRESVQHSDFEKLGVNSKTTWSSIRRAMLDELGFTQRRLGRSLDYLLDPAKRASEEDHLTDVARLQQGEVERYHERLKKREEGLPKSSKIVLSYIRLRCETDNHVSYNDIKKAFKGVILEDPEDLDGHLYILERRELIGYRATIVGDFYQDF